MSDGWNQDELRASVHAYIEMLGMERRNQPYVKKQYYRTLAEKFGRTEKAFEYRMQNISYVMTLVGRDQTRLLTPKGILTYLISIPQSAWPQTYAELRDLGLPSEVVDWLEEIFASEYPTPIDGPVVIEAFLCALLEESVYQRIQAGRGPLQRLRQTLQQAFAKSPTRKETNHRQVVDDLVAYMQGLTPEAWPDTMKVERLSIS